MTPKTAENGMVSPRKHPCGTLGGSGCLEGENARPLQGQIRVNGGFSGFREEGR